MEVVKCARVDNLVAKSTKLVVRKYASVITFFPCIHFVLDLLRRTESLLAEGSAYPAPPTLSWCFTLLASSDAG